MRRLKTMFPLIFIVVSLWGYGEAYAQLTDNKQKRAENFARGQLTENVWATWIVAMRMKRCLDDFPDRLTDDQKHNLGFISDGLINISSEELAMIIQNAPDDIKRDIITYSNGYLAGASSIKTDAELTDCISLHDQFLKEIEASQRP